MEKTVKKFYQLKMDELNTEAQLLEQGAISLNLLLRVYAVSPFADMLPEYTQKLADLEKKKDARMAELKANFQIAVNTHEELFKATAKRAEDTYNVCLLSLLSSFLTGIIISFKSLSNN